MLSPERILQVGFGFCGSRALLSAIELGVFTELGKGPRSGGQLRRSLNLNERAAPDLLDALVALGLLDREGDDPDAVYMNTRDSGHFLDRNSPGYIGALLEQSSARLHPLWEGLTGALHAPRQRAWIGAPGETTGAELLVASTQILADCLDFSPYRTLVEIGAVPHVQLSSLLAARQVHLQCTRVASSELFGNPLPRADIILAAGVLSRCSLERKLELIERSYEALRSGGCLIAMEHLIDDQRRGDAFALLMSLNLRIELGDAGAFAAADFDGWRRRAGFGRVEILPLVWPVSALIAHK